MSSNPDDVKKKAEDLHASMEPTNSKASAKDSEPTSPKTERAQGVPTYGAENREAKTLKSIRDPVKEAYRKANEEFEKLCGTRFGPAFYNSWNDANLRIQDALSGRLGKEEQEKAQGALRAAENEFKQAKNASGTGNWLDVCDPMFRVLMAYLELRRAQGKADSFLGRFNDLILGPLKIPFELIERSCDWVDTLRQPYIPGNNIDGRPLHEIEEAEKKSQSKDNDSDNKAGNEADKENKPVDNNATTADSSNDADEEARSTLRL